MVVPIAAASATDMTAMVSEMRAPKISRVHKSRPKLSEPSQWRAEGQAKRFVMSICSTPCVASKGAKAAARRIASEIAAPLTSEALRSARMVTRAPSFQPDARIDRRVDQVDAEVHEREQQREGER